MAERKLSRFNVAKVAKNANTVDPTDTWPAAVGGSRSGAQKPPDMALSVVYHFMSAEVQNEIDRIGAIEQGKVEPGEALRRDRAVSTEDWKTYETINHLSLQRKRAREFVRQISAGPRADDSAVRKGRFTIKPIPEVKPPEEPPAKAAKSQQKLQGIDVAKEAVTDVHLIPIESVEERYDTNRQTGLSKEQVKARQARDGKNVLSPPKTVPVWIQFMRCMVGGFGIILWIAFVMCILAYKPLGDPPDVYNLILAVVIFFVNFAQGLFFFVQERRSSNLMSAFAQLLPTSTRVVREGQLIPVDASELVVGDIVHMSGGEKVPADIRLFEVSQAKVEKSSLTGESEPISLSVNSNEPNVYETKNLALFGTSILEGTAAGIVINTADRTIMGKIARVASSTSSVATSLQREITYFTGVVAVMAACICAIVVVGYYAGIRPKHPGYLSTAAVITNCIAVVVSLMPEGTPVALALILTIVAKRMYAVKILVKKLTVLETLGSATLIASDKTGTLTQNCMTLNHLWIFNGFKEAEIEPQGDPNRRMSFAGKQRDRLEKTVSGCYTLSSLGKAELVAPLVYLLQLMCLCNKTQFEKHDESAQASMKKKSAVAKRKALGNPTEAALLNAADEFIDVDSIRRQMPIIKEIPFSSRRKFHLSLHHVGSKQSFHNSADAIRSVDGTEKYDYFVVVKGAPEYVLGMCNRCVVDGSEVAMDPTLVSKIMKINDAFADNGERVLALAYRKLPQSLYPDDHEFDLEDEEHWTSELCFLGLTGIIDPPREGVPEAIRECHNAHVRVMMVTGDQPATAVAIARDVKIITHRRVRTIADVKNEVPTIVEEPENKAQKNKNYFLNKIKAFFIPPHKRKFVDEAIVIAGPDIGSLNAKQWDFVLSHKEVVFARTTPQQKLQIVKESRKRGDVVAVTGDGVNDAPALKAADLGIAMGICGSDISKEAANMVLLDDNFVTIVNGIKEGRLLFDNLKKVVCYLFPNGSFSEIIPVLATIFIGMPMPLSTFQMIIICVGSDMIGSLGLIHESAESDIMRRPPRDAHRDRLVDPRLILFAYFFVGIMESTIAFFMYFLTMWMEGEVPPSKLVGAFKNWGNDTWVPHLSGAECIELNNLGQSAFCIALVMAQLWNLLAVRTRYQSIFTQKFQKKLIYYMLGEIGVMILIMYLPIFNQYAYTRPLKYYHYFIPLAMGSIILVSDEIRKFFVRKYPNGILRKLAW